jgi:hypothetical protein
LQEQGYINKKNVGRCNKYTIRPEMPLRHRFDREHTIGNLLEAIGAIHAEGNYD